MEQGFCFIEQGLEEQGFFILQGLAFMEQGFFMLQGLAFMEQGFFILQGLAFMEQGLDAQGFFFVAQGLEDFAGCLPMACAGCTDATVKARNRKRAINIPEILALLFFIFISPL